MVETTTAAVKRASDLSADDERWWKTNDDDDEKSTDGRPNERTYGQTDKQQRQTSRSATTHRQASYKFIRIKNIVFFLYIYIDKITGNRILYFWVSSLSQFSLSPVAECKILSVHPWIFFCFFFVFLFLVDATERKGEPSNFLIATHSKAEMTEKQELPA